jgi:hypothetical protein
LTGGEGGVRESLDTFRTLLLASRLFQGSGLLGQTA